MKKDSVIEKPILEKYVQMWFKNMFDTDFIYKLKPFITSITPLGRRLAKLSTRAFLAPSLTLTAPITLVA